MNVICVGVLRRHSRFLGCWILFGFLAVPGGVRAAPQEQQQTRPAGVIHPPGEPSEPVPTPLSVLIEEAETNDPAILAAGEAVRAAAERPAQASALPDPHFTVQEFTVGSPKPFAGWTNSDFAYLGFGASQELPYPGKRRLRGAVAERETDVRRQNVEMVRRDEIEKLRAAYFRLAYLQQTLAILQHNDALVQEMAQAAEARYRVGRGNQQDLLKAQLQHSKILREISVNREQSGEAEAELKRILRRPQDSPDIIAEPLAIAPLPFTPAALLDRAREQSPEIRERGAMIHKSEADVDLARREFRPDFGLSYIWQRTDPAHYRAYYMFTFDVNFPRRKPREAALAEANSNVERARREQESQMQVELAEVKKQIVVVQASDEQAKIYREGLIPQAQATFEAGMAAYESGREDFESLLSAALDVLNLSLEYQQTLLDHQLALTRIERVTGGLLP